MDLVNITYVDDVMITFFAQSNKVYPAVEFACEVHRETPEAVSGSCRLSHWRDLNCWVLVTGNK